MQDLSDDPFSVGNYKGSKRNHGDYSCLVNLSNNATSVRPMGLPHSHLVPVLGTTRNNPKGAGFLYEQGRSVAESNRSFTQREAK